MSYRLDDLPAEGGGRKKSLERATSLLYSGTQNPSTAAVARASRRADGNQAAFAESELEPSPLDAVPSEAGEPDRKHQSVTQVQQPELPPQQRVSQAPHTDRPTSQQAQRQVGAEKARSHRGRRSHRGGGHRPRQALREQHAQMTSRANVSHADQPAQLVLKIAARGLCGTHGHDAIRGEH